MSELGDAIAAGYAASTPEEARAAIARLEPFLERERITEAWAASEQAGMILQSFEPAPAPWSDEPALD